MRQRPPCTCASPTAATAACTGRSCHAASGRPGSLRGLKRWQQRPRQLEPVDQQAAGRGCLWPGSGLTEGELAPLQRGASACRSSDSAAPSSHVGVSCGSVSHGCLRLAQMWAATCTSPLRSRVFDFRFGVNVPRAASEQVTALKHQRGFADAECRWLRRSRQFRDPSRGCQAGGGSTGASRRWVLRPHAHFLLHQLAAGHTPLGRGALEAVPGLGRHPGAVDHQPPVPGTPAMDSQIATPSVTDGHRRATRLTASNWLLKRPHVLGLPADNQRKIDLIVTSSARGGALLFPREVARKPKRCSRI